jgi:hypothetical protein
MLAASGLLFTLAGSVALGYLRPAPAEPAVEVAAN